MARVCFPDGKISTRPNFIKNRRIKREGVLINDKFFCPLCFTSDYKIIRCDVEKERLERLRYTALCNQCGIQIRFNRMIPTVNWHK